MGLNCLIANFFKEKFVQNKSLKRVYSNPVARLIPVLGCSFNFGSRGLSLRKSKFKKWVKFGYHTQNLVIQNLLLVFS